MPDGFGEHFDVNAACNQIRAFNNQPDLAASDFLVGREFIPYAALPKGREVVGVLLVDALFAGQLFREPGEVLRITALYESNRGLYEEQLPRLQGLSLENQPEQVAEIAQVLLHTLLTDPDLHAGRQNYVIAAQFFHWHAPSHLPIVDWRARTAICSLLWNMRSPQANRLDRHVSSEAGTPPVEDYKRWVEFYSQLIQDLTPEARGILTETDYNTLAGEFRRENSLLRILDKVFYWGGG